MWTYTYIYNKSFENYLYDDPKKTVLNWLVSFIFFLSKNIMFYSKYSFSFWYDMSPRKKQN